MAKKISLTRPELKRQRDALTRFTRYLPMLKLKQQQLQMTLRDVQKEMQDSDQAVRKAQDRFDTYREVLADRAGLNVQELSACERVDTDTTSIAGVRVPVFKGVAFPKISYSLFATPAWVDAAIADLREVSRHKAEYEILAERYKLLHRELIKIIQRVNLFEKIKIPEAREAIRVIRIRLGDEMTAGVGRAKIAKSKILDSEAEIYGQAEEKPEKEAVE